MSAHTWVGGRHNGPEKQAIGEEKVSVQLPHVLH